MNTHTCFFLSLISFAFNTSNFSFDCILNTWVKPYFLLMCWAPRIPVRNHRRCPHSHHEVPFDKEWSNGNACLSVLVVYLFLFSILLHYLWRSVFVSNIWLLVVLSISCRTVESFRFFSLEWCKSCDYSGSGCLTLVKHFVHHFGIPPDVPHIQSLSKVTHISGVRCLRWPPRR